MSHWFIHVAPLLLVLCALSELCVIFLFASCYQIAAICSPSF